MEHKPGDRIMGVETEFGCLVVDEAFGRPEAAVEMIKDHVFGFNKLGLIDLHARDDVFEPARSGGFLINGARLYIDAVGSHLEYATAECRNLKDLIAQDRAGQRIVTQAIKELGIDDVVSVYNNSVDHFGGHTFGCHENFLVRMDEDFYGERLNDLIAFLVTRQIFAGVGRVGGHVLVDEGSAPTYDQRFDHPIDYIWVSRIYDVYPDETVQYQLSQRADHILKSIASRVRFNRALINPKWESFYSHDHMQRLHLLFGESNQMEYAYALKVGTTNLVLRLIEDGCVPADTWLERPMLALRSISRDTSYQWPVNMADGSVASAIDVQRRYLEACQGYRGESDEVDWILTEWESTLNQLQRDPMALKDRLDWVAKLAVVEQYRADENLSWYDDALQSVDLEYHNIDRDKSLFHALQEMGETTRVVSDLDIIDAMTEPPRDTRALGRGQVVRKILQRKQPRFYVFDWNAAAVDRHRVVEFADPFETYAEIAETV